MDIVCLTNKHDILYEWVSECVCMYGDIVTQQCWKKSLRGLGHNNCTQILFKIFPFFHSHRVRVSHQKQQTATSHNHFYWCIFHRHFLVSNAVVYYDVCLVQNSRSNLLFFMHMVGFWTTIAIAIENINIKKKWSGKNTYT